MDISSKVKRKGFSNPILKIFMEGVYDENCELFKFQGKWPILQKIWSYVYQYLIASIKTSDISLKERLEEDDSVSLLNFHKPSDRDCLLFSPDGQYQNQPTMANEDPLIFPKPSDIDIHMMPFIFAKSFKDSKLPQELRGCYWDMIWICGEMVPAQIGKVCYLTVKEGWVEKGHCLCRTGIHVHHTGKVHAECSEIVQVEDDSAARAHCVQHILKGGMDQFGILVPDCNCNYSKFLTKGGIFVASSVPHLCRLWNCEIRDDSVICQHGDIDNLRNFLPDNHEDMYARDLYWLTDRTPYEYLPMKEKIYCQYFRLVTSPVSIWFESLSTKNPLGVVPDTNITRIV